MRICAAVIGAGSWGTTVAHLMAHNTPTVLWARDDEVARAIHEGQGNPRYLGGFELHGDLRSTSSLADAVSGADLVVMGVPSHGFRSTLIEVAAHLRAWVPVVSLTKGLEQGSRRRMTEVINEVLPGHPYGVLTGPNLAKEILAGDAAAAVLAMSDDTIAGELNQLFATRLFRVYTNPDVIGCEVAGALKNVMAIASGMADGLGTGDNTRAAVITRGLGELTRLGVAMGGEAITFSGLAGMGDLVATCISTQSRNRHVGEELGRGKAIDEIIAEMSMVAEGVKTASVVMELAEQYGVEMPIAEQVHAVLYHGRSANEAYRGLLGRRYRDEMDGLAAPARAQ
jgi:glycerol-3-phosphate dehydrogenase (NAD(P)+)